MNKRLFFGALAITATGVVLVVRDTTTLRLGAANPTSNLLSTPVTTRRPHGKPDVITKLPARLHRATADQVLDLDAQADARDEALYDLTQAGHDALPELRKILATPLPDDLTRREFEVSLRITTLEAIDHLAQGGADVKQTLLDVLNTYDENALHTLALIGLQGLDDGRPGKIKRFVDEMEN